VASVTLGACLLEAVASIPMAPASAPRWSPACHGLGGCRSDDIGLFLRDSRPADHKEKRSTKHRYKMRRRAGAVRVYRVDY
jgi:hypothetical protein